MNTAPKNTGILTAVIAAIAVPLSGWAQPYDGGTDYKITLPGAEPSFSWQSGESTDSVMPHTEMLFKLAPVAVLDGESEEPKSHWNGGISLLRIDFLKPGDARMQDLHRGFSYSAALDINHDPDQQNRQEFAGESYFISSRQLGIHYGRLGSVNYSGVDLSFRQFNDKTAGTRAEQNDKELWSLGVTTGRRFALTGLDTTDPIWTVSLRGQFNVIEKPNENVAVENQQWYLSPGLHWEHDSFKMSADVLMPFLQSGEYEEETDYKIRAKIQKRF